NHQSLGFLPRTAVSFSVILLSDLRVQCRLRLLLRAQSAEASSRPRRLSMIHPTAVIDPKAELDSDVKVGPYALIEGSVQIGSGTEIQGHAVISGCTRVGKNNRIFSAGSELQSERLIGCRDWG